MNPNLSPDEVDILPLNVSCPLGDRHICDPRGVPCRERCDSKSQGRHLYSTNAPFALLLLLRPFLSPSTEMRAIRSRVLYHQVLPQRRLVVKRCRGPSRLDGARTALCTSNELECLNLLSNSLRRCSVTRDRCKYWHKSQTL